MLGLMQERKVIIFATTRSNTEANKRKAMGFVENRRRMNGAHYTLNVLTLSADTHLASGHHARTGSADRDWRPGSTGERRIVAHFLELRLSTWRIDREKARLGSCSRRSGAWI